MDGYASSQGSNSPVPEPPPPPLSQTQTNFSSLPQNIRSISFSDPNYQRYFCTCGAGDGNLMQGLQCGTLSRPETSHYHSSLHLNGSYATGYSGYDGRNRLTDEEDSACPALLEREFHSLHRNVPALRRAGIDTTTIRQHFYPDGGWGWIVCGVAFLAHVLTSGFQLSYGFLLLFTIQHLGHDVATEAGWLGAASWSVSMLSAPVIIAFCRRKSTRLTAVLGGLVLALGILFASFATQLNQVAFSYGIVMGIGASMVRESSMVMIGHYFKKRRQFVEMITMSGEGVGIALFSVILKEGVGKMGWRLGLQAITGFVSLSFFMGLLYRPASLYHPQRRAIQHLKNQRKKVKEKKTHVRTPKPPFIDFTPFKSSTVRMLIITSSISALGIYSPIFFMSLHGAQEGYDVQDLVLLQTFLGLSIALGIVSSGSIINKTCRLGYKDFCISTQYVCQVSVVITSISMLILSAVFSYRYLCILSWLYGVGLGGLRYTLKMLALERVRTKYFTKAWGFIKGAESIPVLIGIPLTSFLNESSAAKYGRAGYYVCSAAAAISAILMFFIGYPSGRQSLSKYSGNGSITSHCTALNSECPDLLNRSYSNVGRCSGATGATVNNATVGGAGHWCSPYTTLSNGICGSTGGGVGTIGANTPLNRYGIHQHCYHHPHHYPQHSLHHRRYFPQQHHHQQQQQTQQKQPTPQRQRAHSYTSHFHQNFLNEPSNLDCYGRFACAHRGAEESNVGGNYTGLLSTGSVGRYQGKRLQKSLSFAFPPRDPYTHECTHAYTAATNRCYSRCETPTHSGNVSSYHQLRQHYQQQQQQHQQQQQPFVYQQPSRSRSVPEGLAYASQYCTCPWKQPNTYFDDTASQHRYQYFNRPSSSLSRQHTQSSLGSQQQQQQQPPSQVQVLEQITTSV